MHELLSGKLRIRNRRKMHDNPRILCNVWRGTSSDPCSAPSTSLIVLESATEASRSRCELVLGCAPALPASPSLLALDENFMGRIYVPKPPKKRSNWFSKSKIIARTVFNSLSSSKKLVPVASRRISSVCFPFNSPRLLIIASSSFHLAFQSDVQGPMLRKRLQLNTRH